MNYSRCLSITSAIPLAVALAACGGGPGGPGGPGGGGGTFLGFSEVEPNSTVNIEGTDAAGEAVTAETKYDGDGDIESLTLTTENGSMTWDSSNSTEYEDVSPILLVVDRNDESSSVGIARPEENGFEYQTYGAWVTYDQDGSVTGGDGFSVGSPTEAAAIDTDGTATFEGTAAGIYVSDGGDDTDIMTAKAHLDVDFAGRSIDFKTSDSQLVEIGEARPDLDMSGTLTYAPGTNGFNGGVSTAGGVMSGTASGSFYGPGAEEVGGSFSLEGADEYLRGGFGAVRQ